jgi:hypothetical protein
LKNRSPTNPGIMIPVTTEKTARVSTMSLVPDSWRLDSLALQAKISVDRVREDRGTTTAVNYSACRTAPRSFSPASFPVACVRSSRKSCLGDQEPCSCSCELSPVASRAFEYLCALIIFPHLGRIGRESIAPAHKELLSWCNRPPVAHAPKRPSTRKRSGVKRPDGGASARVRSSS